METMKRTMLGGFALEANEFRKVCGVYLTAEGTLEVDIYPETCPFRLPASKRRMTGNASELELSCRSTMSPFAWLRSPSVGGRVKVGH